MLSPSTITETPITIGAVHALLTQWRSQTQTAKARIPYVLIMEIAELVSRYPRILIKKTFGISNTQLSYFESVYHAAHRVADFLSQSPSPSNTEDLTSSCLTISAGMHSLQTQPTVSCATASIPPQRQEVTPRFVKARYPVDTFSGCVEMPTQKATDDSSTPESSLHLGIQEPPHAHTSHPSVHHDAHIVVELLNQKGVTFRVSLNERQTLLCMQTFAQSV